MRTTGLVADEQRHRKGQMLMHAVLVSRVSTKPSPSAKGYSNAAIAAMLVAAR